tara:strand:- start:92 stop:709 length:618 start_codon:yes stop_codon:yes gene_type:complete
MGMPFYFRDLRDGAVIYFRAYLEGLNEILSPQWSPENYIGRSEPVYTYTRGEREIQFQLKLFAQTKDELNMIYKKINRLTSLCYPEYKKEEYDSDIAVGSIGSQLRMKPPLIKFRLGELFGNKTNELTGFIKNLSYIYPNEGVWEIKEGQRVPKYILADIGIQVIHSKVPSLDFARLDGTELPTNTFYGINNSKDSTGKNIGVGV